MNEVDGRAPAGDVVGVVVPWAVSAVVGGWIGEMIAARTGGGASAALIVLVATGGATLGAVVRWSRHSSRPGAVWGVLGSVLVAASIAGGVLLRADASADGLVVDLAATGGDADMTGTVIAEPRPTEQGWHVLLQIDGVDGRETRERVITMRATAPPLGQRVDVTATARPVPEGGYGRWVARQHAVAIVDVSSWQRVGHPTGLLAASESLRDRVRSAATRHIDGATAGLLVGFVTGDTRLLPADDEEALRSTGLSHLTAVSGSNVGLVAAGVLAVCALLRVGVRVRRMALALMLPWFVFVTRFEPSVLRAGLMAAVMLLATSTGRLRDARHTLAVAVLLLVAIDPRLSASVGLILSATATIGVLMVAPVVRRRLPTRLPERVAELLSITVGAQVAVLPVLLASFGEVPLSSVPANLIAVPAAAVAASIAFVGTAVAVVDTGSAAVLFAMAAPGAAVVLHTARLFADVGGAVSLQHPAEVAALVAAVVWLLVGGSRMRLFAAACGVVALIVASMPFVGGFVPERDFVVTAIDVGQGDAFLVETPRARVLVDAGPDDRAVSWLRRNGIRWIDLVVVTHPHLDHVGGVAGVVERLEVGAVWAAPLETSLPEWAELHRVATRRQVPVVAPVAGAVIRLGDVVIEVLHPRVGRPYRHADSELNESSYVVRVHHDGRRALFAGDVEAAAQRWLLDGDRAQLAAELLAVPHHGSATTDAAFLRAVSPRVGLISVGADNRHGHPAPRTLAALAEADVEVHRTDVHGTVRVTVPRRSDAHGTPPEGATTPTGAGWPGDRITHSVAPVPTTVDRTRQ